MLRKLRLNKLGLLLLPFALNASADAFFQDATPVKAIFDTKENAASVGVNTEKLSKATDALQALVDNKNMAGAERHQPIFGSRQKTNWLLSY